MVQRDLICSTIVKFFWKCYRTILYFKLYNTELIKIKTFKQFFVIRHWYIAKLKNGSYKKLKIESVFVQPDVKGWLVFSCIVPFLTVSLINGTRGLLISLPFYYLFHREGSLPTAFHCFSLATVLHYLPDNDIFKEEASFGF